MSSIAEDIFKFIVVSLFCWFFFLTGETIITLLSIGIHKPRWGGYLGTGSLTWAISEVSLCALGAVFWIGSFPFDI